MRLWELLVDPAVDELWGKDEQSNQVMRNRRGLTGTSMKNGWEPIELFTTAPGDVGDMLSYGGSNKYPIFTNKAVEVLNDLIRDSVELLPVHHDHYHCYIVNIINVVDCLNEANTNFNKWSVIEKYDFLKEKVKGQHIFFPYKRKTASPSLIPIVSDEFKQRVEDHGLRGFRFGEIWSPEPEPKKKDIYDEKNPFLRVISREDLEAHIQKHVGPITNVLKDPSNLFTEVDLYCVGPNSNIKANTIITKGNSYFKMPSPSTVDSGYAELIMHVPSDWDVSNEPFRDDVHGWPLTLLKNFGENVMRKGFWLGQWFVYPNQSDEDLKNTYASQFGVKTFNFDSKIEPYSPGTDFCGVMIAPPFPSIIDVFKMTYLDDGKVIEGDWPIYFHTLIPLYREEINYYFKEGKDQFIKRIVEHGIEKVFDLNRESIC
ncbi:suppressor of fused domain protein [Neobacillus sp. WH10]|uniref:suppressor of fused domain protein n=1 Tax=Neobacillus sp. WH10 TaxID=3047873 RepID=UPI0024C1FEC7|nr:suppressor of fused domain protein [Neobacillus sp. WH10]WHY77280.1 suppressor of fused domain protein [Neobacillus sp. WH10]